MLIPALAIGTVGASNQTRGYAAPSTASILNLGRDFKQQVNVICAVVGTQNLGSRNKQRQARLV